MALQKTDILEVLEANFKKAQALMTEDLAAEFQRKILTPALLQDYADTIYVAIQMKDELNAIRIENWMVDRFKKGGFGKKLKDNGIDPVRVYETLLQGFFDYRK
jgi:hypothetical protein